MTREEAFERLVASGLVTAGKRFRAAEEYSSNKKKEKEEKEKAKSQPSPPVKVINTAESNTAARARMSEGIQAAADKYIADNGEALQKLFYGLPYVKEASKTEQGKLDVEKWLGKQLKKGGSFYRQILNHYSENTKSRLGELRPFTERALRVVGRKRANYRHAVWGTKNNKQELQGYPVANAQKEATDAQKKKEYDDIRKEFLDDLAHGGEGKVLDLEKNEFELIPWDVPSDIPPQYRDAIILLMNLFDASGLAPASYSPPPSPAEKPVPADPD